MSTNTHACNKAPSRIFLVFLTLSLMVSLMNSSVPTPLYPFYKQQLQLSAVELTLIFGVYGVGVLLSLLTLAGIAGRLPDLRKLLLPAASLVVLGAWLFSQGNSLWQLGSGRLIAGLGSGAMTVGVNLALLRFGPADNGKLAALLATLAMVSGLALGPLLSGAALQLELYPLMLPFWLIMLLGLAACVGVLGCWPSAPTLAPTVANPPPIKSPGLIQSLQGIGLPYHLCAWAVFFSWSFAACVFVIGPGAAEQLLGLQDHGIFGYGICAYLLIAGASQLFCQRLEARRALLGGLLCQNLAFVMLLMAFYQGSLLLAVLAMIVGGYAYGAIFVGSARLINQLAQGRSHGTLIAYFYMTIYGFNAVPIPLGLLVDSSGMARAINSALIVFLVLGSALLLMAHRTRLACPRP
ncbi:MFS transporter [Pseudomonas sp. PH1b]|uniref:MFS transporter n=1 Tax=Pseudomonas sp. PH1b TaxID=1397282 RepID=UPI0004696570|nr:MFS transporter [Pseudomonas sp. PH1b]